MLDGAGIFIPSLVVGACFGRIVGLAMEWIQYQYPSLPSLMSAGTANVSFRDCMPWSVEGARPVQRLNQDPSRSVQLQLLQVSLAQPSRLP